VTPTITEDSAVAEENTSDLVTIDCPEDLAEAGFYELEPNMDDAIKSGKLMSPSKCFNRMPALYGNTNSTFKKHVEVKIKKCDSTKSSCPTDERFTEFAAKNKPRLLLFYNQRYFGGGDYGAKAVREETKFIQIPL